MSDKKLNSRSLGMGVKFPASFIIRHRFFSVAWKCNFGPNKSSDLIIINTRL